MIRYVWCAIRRHPTRRYRREYEGGYAEVGRCACGRVVTGAVVETRKRSCNMSPCPGNCGICGKS